MSLWNLAWATLHTERNNSVIIILSGFFRSINQSFRHISVLCIRFVCACTENTHFFFFSALNRVSHAAVWLTSPAFFSASSSFSWASFTASQYLSSSSSVALSFFCMATRSSSSCRRERNREEGKGKGKKLEKLESKNTNTKWLENLSESVWSECYHIKCFIRFIKGALSGKKGTKVLFRRGGVGWVQYLYVVHL